MVLGEPATTLKTTLQLPLPAESVMEQLMSAPVMFTVPVGVMPAPLTVTLTATDWPTVDGLGALAVMTVTLGPGITVWLSESELVA
jgi:hypothetical protein